MALSGAILTATCHYPTTATTFAWDSSDWHRPYRTAPSQQPETPPRGPNRWTGGPRSGESTQNSQLADDNFYPVTLTDLRLAREQNNVAKLEELTAIRTERFQLME